MQKTVVKRFGVNSLGAESDWIIERRMIDKNESIPDGYEYLTNTQYNQQIEGQREEYQQWLDIQPTPKRNLLREQEILSISIFNKPSTSYRIYKYVSPNIVNIVSDVTLPPWGIDYKISVLPKLKAIRAFDKGFLINVKWFIWDYENNNPIEEILKVSIEYMLIDDAPMESSKSVISRRTVRQWIKEDNTYDPELLDIKVTSKIYETQLERNSEGERRRNNIFVDLTEQYVALLTILSTNGNISDAQDIGKAFLSEISSDLSDYKSIGSNKILTTLDSIINPLYILATPINDVDLPFEKISVIRQLVSSSEGYTVLEFIKEKFKGNI